MGILGAAKRGIEIATPDNLVRTFPSALAPFVSRSSDELVRYIQNKSISQPDAISAAEYSYRHLLSHRHHIPGGVLVFLRASESARQEWVGLLKRLSITASTPKLPPSLR